MPTLETERLILRRFRETDLDDFNEYAKNPNVGPNAGWKPHESKEESMEILKQFIDSKEVWAIVEKAQIRSLAQLDCTKIKGVITIEQKC